MPQACQANSEGAEELEVIDGDRSEKVSNRNQTDERAPFCHSEMEGAMLIHQIGCFR